MGLFGSLFTGVSALFAQSQNTAVISNNIANLNTVGFKRSEVAFESLVTSQSRSSTYSPGTVTANRLQQVNQQGALQQTASTTDAGVSGNGFFAVKRENSDTQEFLYTRAGQFSEDSQGLLRNAAGFVLYAWPLDSNGNLPANQGDLTSLVAADVAFLGGLTRPTSSAELAINLNASEVDETLDAADTSAADFTRGLTVFDSLGGSQVLTFEFTKTYGPHATAAGTRSDLLATNNLISDLGMSDGDTFTVATTHNTGNIGPITFEVDDGGGVGAGNTAVETVADIIDGINAAFAGIAGATAYLGNDGEFFIAHNDFQADPNDETLVLEDTNGTPLNDIGITLVPAGGPQTFTSNNLNGVSATSLTPYDNGTPGDSPAYSGDEFPAFQNFPGSTAYNQRGWWQLDILHPDGTVESRGLLNFNQDGTLNAAQDTDGNIDINLTQINWGNGSEAQNIDIDIERFSQFTGNYDVIFSDQNGAELGLRTGIEITREGRIVARFSNGASSDLYQAPLITFANSNGLTEVSGTAYTESEDSGEENLREAGEGGAGFVEPSTLEGSNVDLADEFAKLIIAQRAYGAGTRLVNTVDQMTEDLLRLR